jgi:hypothetical protein
MEMNANQKNLADSIDFERSKSFIYGSSFNEGSNFGKNRQNTEIVNGIS